MSQSPSQAALGNALPTPCNSRPSALALSHAIQSGEKTAVSILEDTYRAIQAHDASLGAFLCLTQEKAFETAQAVDKRVASGETLPLLAGVPIAIKDNINITDTPTTCASNILKGYVSPYNATVCEKLNTHGLPVVGKTNLDEFAMGSSTENSALQATKNPWDTERVPGGSSGGSAVAVSGGMVPLSLGSDTGGSVRQPASFCGIVGIKPTYGLVSRYGLVAFGSSLDQISPFARTVADTAAILQIIAGFDPNDSTSIHPHPSNTPLDYMSALQQGIEGLRVGVITELEGDGLQPDVAEALAASIEKFKTLGASIQRVSIPSIRYGVAAYYIIATAEASANLARYDGVRFGFRKEAKNGDVATMFENTRAEGFGAEVKRRIMLGTFCLSAGYYDAYYGKAQLVRKKLKHELRQAWQQVDVLICPTSPTTAFKIGEKASDPVSMYLSDIATIPVNIAGIPAINVPCGFDQNNLPIGLQLWGPHLSEGKLFQAAHAFEQAVGLYNLVPKAYQE